MPTCAGLLYGVMGVLGLGVWIDVGLIVAAVSTIFVAVRIPRRAHLRWPAQA